MQRAKQHGGIDQDGYGEQRTQAEADGGGQPVDLQILGFPVLLDAAGGIEISLVGEHHGADDGDDEIGEDDEILGWQVTRDLRDQADGDAAPVGMDAHSRHGERNHEEA